MNLFENIENYMNAVWNENLINSYTTKDGFLFGKYDLFSSAGFFEEFRINGISPYKAMLAFVEFNH